MTFVIFLAVLSVLVLVHELGHFLAARALGIKVEEFAFGLPFTAPLVKFRRGETDFAVYPLLFGGFVRLYGEEGPPLPLGKLGASEGRPRSFWDRGRKQRMTVIVAGVVMNVVLAVVGFVVLYAAVGVPVKKVNKVTVVAVEADGPAAAAGVREDDRVVMVEGVRVETGEEFGRLMRSWAGVAVNLTVERGAGVPLLEGIAEREIEKKTVTVVGRVSPPTGQGPLGVAIANYPYLEMKQCSMLKASCSMGAVWAGIVTTGEWIGRTMEGLRGIGKSLVAGKAPEGVSGPIGIYQLTDVVARGGFWPVLELTAVLSVNLGVFNVLPIPALDGGRMFFIWLEWLRKKRVTSELEQKINSWGMAILLVLLAAISLQDVIRAGVVDNLLKFVRLK